MGQRMSFGSRLIALGLFLVLPLTAIICQRSPTWRRIEAPRLPLLPLPRGENRVW